MEEIILTCIALLIINIIQFILIKIGASDKAIKLEEKKKKLLAKIEKQHNKTQEKFVKEELKIKELKNDSSIKRND